MKKNVVWESKYFCGQEISEYGQQHGYMDYKTLASAFPHIINNDIITNTAEIGCWDIVNGCEYDEETDEVSEIFQYFIVDDRGAEILQDYTDEILFYNETLDLYVWGVTHYGTSWDYVLTDIRLDLRRVFPD